MGTESECMYKLFRHVLEAAFFWAMLAAASTDAGAQSSDVVLECGGPNASPVSIVIPGTKGGTAIAAGKPADRYAVTDREYVLAYKPMGEVCYVKEPFISPRGETYEQSRPLKFWTTTITRSFDSYYGRKGWDGLQLCGYEEVVVDRYTGAVKAYGPVKQYRDATIESKLVRGWRGESGMPPDGEFGNYDGGRGASAGVGEVRVAPSIEGSLCQPAQHRL